MHEIVFIDGKILEKALRKQNRLAWQVFWFSAAVTAYIVANELQKEAMKMKIAYLSDKIKELKREKGGVSRHD